MKRVPHEQNTLEWTMWREERRMTTGFASEAPALMGVARFDPKNARHLWMEKKGIRERRVYERAVQHGHNLEPLARSLLEERCGDILAPWTICSDDERYAASLDGINPSGTVIAEIKCPVSGEEGHLWGMVNEAEDVPLCYRPQFIQQVALSGCEVAWFLVFIDPDTFKLIQWDADVCRTAREVWWEKGIRPQWDAFLESLQGDTPIGEYDDPEFVAAAKVLASIEDEYRDVSARYEAAKKALLSTVPEGMGAVGCGYRVTVKTRRGAINEKALLKAGIDVSAFRGKDTTYREVRRA